MSKEETKNRSESASYWTKNLRRLALLLTIWFLASYGASILFVDALDSISFFGFKLGFWFAQQGSILIFVLLIVAYVKTMNALDDEYASSEDEEEGS